MSNRSGSKTAILAPREGPGQCYRSTENLEAIAKDGPAALPRSPIAFLMEICLPN